MAVDDQLPIQTPLSAASTLSSSSSSSFITERRHLVQVATNNSSTFIQFPANSRQIPLCIPTDRSRAIYLKTREFSHATDIRSISNPRSSSIPISDRERHHSQQRYNPILNNSLLNHRKEQPKSSPIKPSTDYSLTTRLCLSSKAVKPISNDHPTSIIPANTSPQTESSISDQQILPNEDEDNDQQEAHRLDKNKYDYITRWLQEVEQAKYPRKTFTKTKRPKNKCI